MADTIVQTPKGPRRVTEKVRAAARANAIKARAAFLKKHKAGKIKYKPRGKGIKAADGNTVEIPLEAIPAGQPVAKKKYAKRTPTVFVGDDEAFARFMVAAWTALNNLKGN